MKYPKYLYQSATDMLRYEFTSEGIKGRIKKLVEYTETGTENVYNLGFGDYNEMTQDIDDTSVTNNGDSLKVLSTVASTIYAFVEKYPKAWIVATGSTSVRTRLYRMGITNNLPEILEYFVVFGYNLNQDWEIFVMGEDYEAFLITKKENI